MKNLEMSINEENLGLIIMLLKQGRRTAPNYKLCITSSIKEAFGVKLTKDSYNELLSLQFDGVNDEIILQNFLTK